jgi:hypothetical protein
MRARVRHDFRRRSPRARGRLPFHVSLLITGGTATLATLLGPWVDMWRPGFAPAIGTDTWKASLIAGGIVALIGLLMTAVFGWHDD